MNRFPALDGIRGIAIVLVMGAHGFYGRLYGGFAGVDLFFVLSGFLITRVLLQDDTTLSGFYIRRAQRLLPALACALVMVGFLWSGPGFWRALAPATLYYANLIASVHPERMGMLLHTWSLSTEEQFYLIWPVTLLVLCGRLRWQMVAVAAIGCALLRASLHVAWPTAFGVFSPLTKIDALLAGGALALAPRRPQLRGAAWLFLAALPAFALLMTDKSQFYFVVGAPLISVGALSLICEATAASNSPVERALSFGPLVWVGRRSYGLYLYHFPIFIATERLRVPHSLSNFAFVTFLRVTLSIAAAYFSFRFI